MSIGVKYPLEVSSGTIRPEQRLAVERVLSVLQTRKGERPFHPDYGSPAPIFSVINRETLEFPEIEDVDTLVTVLVGGLIFNASLSEDN